MPTRRRSPPAATADSSSQARVVTTRGSPAEHSAAGRPSRAPTRARPTPPAALGERRPGGRTARNRAAIFEATLAELAAHGYAGLSFEAVAAQAGVHKTTIYRRWRTRDQLVAAAFMDIAAHQLKVADTGDIDRDARVLARSVAATLNQPVVAAAARATLSLSAAEVRADIVRRFWSSRLAAVGPVIERAAQRGQLPPGTDPADVIAAIAAPLYFRLLVLGEPLRPSDADAAAAAALCAARCGIFTHAPARRRRPSNARITAAPDLPAAPRTTRSSPRGLDG
jgi:AcrR family transcriptional regulator